MNENKLSCFNIRKEPRFLCDPVQDLYLFKIVNLFLWAFCSCLYVCIVNSVAVV